MAEYVDREALYRFLTEQKDEETGAYSRGRNRGLDIARSALHSNCVLPAADMAPVVHGRWVKNKLLSNDFYDAESCDRCGELVSWWFGKLPDYCPNCGAKMDL